MGGDASKSSISLDPALFSPLLLRLDAASVAGVTVLASERWKCSNSYGTFECSMKLFDSVTL